MPDSVPLGFTVQVGDDFIDGLRDIVLNDERLQPAQLRIDCDHAVYIEFGTSPARKGSSSSGKRTGAISDVEKELREWVKTKKHISDPAECNRIAYSIYHNIMNHGIPPQPFFRPAIYSTLDEFFPQSSAEGTTEMNGATWFDMGRSLKDIMDIMADTMKYNLESNGTVYKGEITRAIRVVTGSELQNSKIYPETGPQSGIPEEVWKSKEMAFDRTIRKNHNNGGRTI